MASSAAEDTAGNDLAALRVEKRKWQNTARALNQKVAAAEKLVTFPPEYQGELNQDVLAYSSELQKEQRRLAASSRSVREMVASAKDRAEACRPDSVSIAQLATVLEEVECSIAGMKDSMREEYNAMMDQEDVLLRELEAFCERLSSSSWEDDPQQPKNNEAQAAAGRSGHRAAQSSVGNGTLLPEVVAFEEFREEFGDTGNWHEEEHKEFLRILRACKYDYADAVMVCCERILMGFEREDIIAHARWHQEYVDLEIRKKLALAEWKEQRAMQREAAKSAAMVHTDQQASSARKEAEEREWRQQQKQALEEWRRQKQEDAQRQLESERQKENEQRREKAKQMELQLQKKAGLAPNPSPPPDIAHQHAFCVVSRQRFFGQLEERGGADCCQSAANS
mmetsp:Transcript_1733/g.5017  ORF Transcript_1733/g.5017 Transcript_1733/m.5017 type:complete len:395 (-) Transcript_1733:869-2053(-)